LWSGVDKPEAQAKVFLFAPEARLGLRKNSLRVRTLVAEVISTQHPMAVAIATN
jgi:hypothetical protein